MTRLFAIVLFAAGFWLGMRADGMLHEDRCREAGGTYDAGYCYGAEPL